MHSSHDCQERLDSASRPLIPLVNMVAGPPAPTLDYEVTGSEATDVSLADGKSG